MVSTLEAIKGGGGSIKVGATGTISTLMSRELDSTKSAPQTPKLCRNKCPAVPNLVSSAPTTPRKLKPRTSMDEASSSTTTAAAATTTAPAANQKRSEISQKTKHYNRRTNRVPMHKADNLSIDGTPRRDKSDHRRGSYIVEVVDIKCRNPDRAWAAPITNRLKKLGFSKLSETIA